MIFAFLSTFIQAFADVFYKKSLVYGIWSRAHELATYNMGLLLLIYFLSTGFSLLAVPLMAFFVIWLVIVIDSLRQPLMQQVYREEKISVIMPYLNLSKIFIISASFFIFQDVSLISFIITLITVGIIIGASVDLKTLKLPRNFSKILSVEILRATAWLIGAWIIVTYSEIIFLNLYVVLGLLYMIVLTYFTQQYWDLKSAPLKFWTDRFLSSLWWISWFLSLIVIKNLWLSIWILLGFIWIWVTLLFSYILLWDKPSKKDIVLTITVSLLVWAGFYFK